MRILTALFAGISAAIAVTPPDQIQVPAGFKVELLREAGPSEGSWICMAIDDVGRLYISSQDKTPESGFSKDSKWGGMWRATLRESAQSSVPSAQSGKAADDGKKLSTEHWALSTPAITKWERVNVPVGDAMGMLWAFDSLYVSGNGPDGRGIYRCKSTLGDGNLDSAVLFKAIPEGSGEHGAHAIVLGPDKKLYIVNGNTTPMLAGVSPDSPYRNWGEDDLLPRVNDPVATFFDKIKAPYGCVYRTDENGTKWELFAGGFRNPYDIAFNTDGELFTYDSDMEWDRGLPWYRPTRLIHVVPGGEYGFREGSAKWPPWYPDSLPAVCDIGVGCPTGMKFGTGARDWPEKYQRALFFIDWTYGRLLAAHLLEKGASYTAKNDIKSYTYPKEAEANHDVEVFLSGKGMPMTDMEFGKDGAMYFTTGGRGTSAALYRVSYEGKRDAGNAPEAQQKLAGGAGSGASATTGSSSTKPSAPDGAQEKEYAGTATDTNAGKDELSPFREMKRKGTFPKFDLKDPKAQATLMRTMQMINKVDAEFWAWTDFNHFLAEESYGPENSIQCMDLSIKTAGTAEAKKQMAIPGLFKMALRDGLTLARNSAPAFQDPLLNRLTKVSLVDPPDNVKLLKFRILELSFARQGRPSAENVKALVAELSQQYPAKGAPPHGAPSVPAATKANGEAALESGATRGADVAGEDARRSTARLNRELSQLLIWLTNPELGELNSELAAKAAGSDGISPSREGTGTAGSHPSLQAPVAPNAASTPVVAASGQTNANIATDPKPETRNQATAAPAGDQPASSRRQLLGPVPNPGASVFPGRKGDDALAAAGREVIEKTLDLMDKAESQEEQVWYALVLRWAYGWTPAQRARYFRWFHEKAGGYAGGNSLSGFINKIRTEALARCTDAERAALGHLASAPTTKALVELKPRAFVQAWTMADLEPSLGDVGKGRNFARGRELFGQAQCILCHKMGVTGGNVGPDLTAVASRFPRKDILTAILDPNAAVSDQYAMMTFTVRRGEKLQEVTGLVQEDTGGTFTVLTDPLSGKTEAFYHHVVVKKEKAAVSNMPPGLLYTLTKDEVLDLLAYLESGGKAEAGNFK